VCRVLIVVNISRASRRADSPPSIPDSAAMRLVLLASLVLLPFVIAEDGDVDESCHPVCRWECSDPVCPQVCLFISSVLKSFSFRFA